MKTLRLDSPGEFKFLETEKPTLTSEMEVLVKIHSIGICGTDYHAFRGKQPFFSYPRILGHELGVEIMEVGDQVKNLKVGQKASVEPYLNCGECHACKLGKSNCCEKLKVLGVHIDGGMCEYLILPADKLHTSEVLNYDQLALVETLGIGCHAVNRVEVKSGQKALVLGAGPIGLTVLEFLKIAGTETSIFDLNAKRLDFCSKHQKANHILSETESLEIAGYDVVFDATGNPNSMKLAPNYVAHGGKLVFVGLFQGDYSFFDPDFHRKELTIMASRNSQPADFHFIIKQMEAGSIDVDSWISLKVPFEEVKGSFDDLLSKTDLIKAVINLN